MSKGSKVVFVVFTQHCIEHNVTHLTHVKRVKEALTVLIVTQYRYIKYYVERVKRLCYVGTMVCMSKGSKVISPSTCFNIHSIGWYGWKGVSLSFPKLLAD